MVRNIVSGEQIFVKALPATKDDLDICVDLKDTLLFNRKGCVGMAANMIGFNKRIIVFLDEKDTPHIMINPNIIKYEGEYSVSEGCLSLEGVRPTKRYKKIKVEYYNEEFQKRLHVYTDFVAEIIQHEIDHCDGKII